jgi:hypothetical protein
VAGYNYQEPAKTSTSGQQYYSTKTYTIGLSDSMPFGKHKRKPVRQVLSEKPDYLSWMLREVQRVTFTDKVPEALTRSESCKKYPLWVIID